LNALQWHTVKSGESLSIIARKLRVSRNDLAEANYLKTTSKVRAGQRLVVPRMPTAALLAQASTSDAPVTAAALVVEDADEIPPTLYKVRAGDTLSAIARRHGTTVDQLKALNNLKNTALSVGARLIIQPARPANAQQ
jgi:membrane-bound lytic murein transglycosylase D